MKREGKSDDESLRGCGCGVVVVLPITVSRVLVVISVSQGRSSRARRPSRPCTNIVTVHTRNHAPHRRIPLLPCGSLLVLPFGIGTPGGRGGGGGADGTKGVSPSARVVRERGTGLKGLAGGGWVARGYALGSACFRFIGCFGVLGGDQGLETGDDGFLGTG